jgi:DNA replication and repair protein RecF
MRIHELQIINFRNLRFLRAEFAPGLNLVHGANAQGKTNLLEAIHMLVTGRSFRTTSEREMVPWVRDDYEATLVRARVKKAVGEERFLLTFNQGEKHITVNGEPIRKLGELIGRINAVLFTPSDLQLVRGAPGLRRRFLDICLSQVNRTYLFHLQRYDLALRQRNALLKQHQRRPSLRDELAAWDDQLAEHGAGVIHARKDAVERLSRDAAEHYGRIAGMTEALAIEYRPSPALAGAATPGEIRARLLGALHSAINEDIRRGATSAGPHRDDLTFLIDARDARDFGSQGQQRSCVLALKFAELLLMREATGEPPLLLLDDLMSELDESRKQALLTALDPDVQTFLTATEKELVTPFAKPQKLFLMEDGELRDDN